MSICLSSTLLTEKIPCIGNWIETSDDIYRVSYSSDSLFEASIRSQNDSIGSDIPYSIDISIYFEFVVRGGGSDTDGSIISIDPITNIELT